MLMDPEGMGWSWEALQNTPVYVRRYCWDLLQIKRAAQHAALKKARSSNAHDGNGPGPGH